MVIERFESHPGLAQCYLDELCIPASTVPLTFLVLVPLSVAICSYPGQGYNSATGHFVRLVRSPGTVYHWTFVQHLHYQLSKTCSRHIFSNVLTSPTNCFVKYAQRILYGAFVVNVAMLLRLINFRFIIIIIIYYHYNWQAARTHGPQSPATS